MNQERVLIVAQKHVTEERRGTMRVSRKRLIGFKEHMNSLPILLLRLQTLSQELCMKQEESSSTATTSASIKKF
jgi:hypothetical protein